MLGLTHGATASGAAFGHAAMSTAWSPSDVASATSGARRAITPR